MLTASWLAAKLLVWQVWWWKSGRGRVVETDQLLSLPHGKSVLFKLLQLTDSLHLEYILEELTKINCN